MKTEGATIYLDPISRFSPGLVNTSFVDNTEIHFVMDNKDIIRLYEGIKRTVEIRLKIDFDQYCDDLFKE